MSFKSIPACVQQHGIDRPKSPAYFVKKGGDWVATNWETYASEIKAAAKSMIALGLEAGGTVAILGFNRPEWTIFDIACMTAGGAPAGIYTTNSPEEVHYIVHHAESRLLLVENEDQWKKVDQVRAELPALHKVVMMKGAAKIDDELVLSWDEFMAAGENIEDGVVEERMAGLEPDALATFIYTSGTTGPPKGVMLTHENLSWTGQTAVDMTGIGPGDCALSYLPLSHIAEQMFTIHGPARSGYSVYFAESIDKVPDNLKEVQPTVFFGVPRIWEKFHAGITGKLAEASGFKAALVRWAMGVGRDVSALKMKGKEPTGLLSIQYKIADKAIFAKLKPAVGLGRAKICVSGAAPIGREVLDFFASLDILVSEVYGQSEGCGPTSFNLPGDIRMGSVGKPIPGAEVKIADDGEILLKGKNVFKGYYKDEDATNETLIDGWLHSGDLGRIDADGFLHITGRKKEILITAGGKNVAPKNIEADLKNHELINEAVVIGDRRKYLTAIVTLEPDAAAKYASNQGVTMDALPDHQPLLDSIQAHVEQMNQKYARVEQIKKFRVVPRNFTVEDKELTATLKVKRRMVYQNWGELIESMYEG